MSDFKLSTLYVAIDSDFLRNFSYFYCGKETVEVKKKKNKVIEHNSGYFYHMKDLLESGLVKFVVTSTVFNEVCYSDFYKDFIKNYCMIPKIDSSNYHKYAMKVTKLANAYCTEEIGNDNGVKLTAMHKQYIAAIGETAPSNDAFIMAEATVLGLSLLTCNEKDFIQNKIKQRKSGKTKYEYENDIVRGIAAINKKHGYVFDSLNNPDILIVPRPYPPHLFAILTKTTKDVNEINIPKTIVREDGTVDVNELQ